MSEKEEDCTDCIAISNIGGGLFHQQNIKIPWYFIAIIIGKGGTRARQWKEKCYKFSRNNNKLEW